MTLDENYDDLDLFDAQVGGGVEYVGEKARQILVYSWSDLQSVNSGIAYTISIEDPPPFTPNNGPQVGSRPDVGTNTNCEMVRSFNVINGDIINVFISDNYGTSPSRNIRSQYYLIKILN